MRPFLFFAAALSVAASRAAPVERAGLQRFASGPARVSLVELYTSEGCSSCPPAERWLGALRDDRGLWNTFVPVAFHVNFWDRLGWPDKFASREGTQREYAYAKAWGGESVYTPCLVRDGAEWRAVGGKMAPAGGAPVGKLTASYDGAALRGEFAPAAPQPGDAFEIHAALLGGGIVSKVTAGENSGETLRHEFIVLALAHGAPGADLELPPPLAPAAPRRALAVWVTRRGELVPLQATGGWLAP